MPWCRIHLRGLHFWSWALPSAVEGDSVGVKAYVAMTMGGAMSEMRQMVEVVGSSLACSWDGLGWFVAVKSKLRWRGPVAYDDR